MIDITPKTRHQGQRGYVIRTRPWESIIEHYRKHEALAPMLHFVEAVASSSVSSKLFAGTSMDDLLISDSADFHIGDSTLRISYSSGDRQFQFSHISFSGHDDQKVSAESEALPTLRLFLRVKYGILFDIPVA